ncbi:PC4 domain-containing protein [Nephila pilipes]|uniref:PC4 domain-containing protein n=1 Tax=Nephila pilipes TaxID=299642 RepID=A0A8X6QNS3_NEPPI|nr:PC4 domain-containing protein [Nephila pilipes]
MNIKSTFPDPPKPGNWKKTNNSLTPNLRKLPPRRPADADEGVDDPAWSAVQFQLVPCSVCGRTFFPERLPVHRRVCKGKPSPRPLKRAASLREKSSSSTEGVRQLKFLSQKQLQLLNFPETLYP